MASTRTNTCEPNLFGWDETPAAPAPADPAQAPNGAGDHEWPTSGEATSADTGLAEAGLPENGVADTKLAETGFAEIGQSQLSSAAGRETATGADGVTAGFVDTDHAGTGPRDHDDVPFFDDEPAGAPPQRSGSSPAAHPPTVPSDRPSSAKMPAPERPPSGSITSRALAASGAGITQHREPSDYLSGLNPEQRAAVEAIDGPVLVLAGAGTGKTRVLTTRIAHILAQGRAWPSQILAVTFTNKAAREMRERIEKLVGLENEGMPWLGTFHSVSVKILRRHAELVDLKSGFTILDTDDQIRLLKQLIEAEKLDPKRWPARQLSYQIDGWKNRGLRPEQVPEGEAMAFGNGKGVKLYAAYQVRLKELNAVDFGDLLLETLRLFNEHPDILADYRRRFRFLLVDEYQDTNVAQYLWLRLLAGQPEQDPQTGRATAPNLCCVGDDDQSIYGWRGAEVDNILRFDNDFPGAQVFRVERNYRSTGHILNAASALIAHNEGRLGKTLQTEIGPGEPVRVRGVWDDEAEARATAEDIATYKAGGTNYNGIAILVRASFQMRAFEDRFIAIGLPYRVIGGPRFYERAEIKDACAYLEVTVNPANDLKFERIFNTPKRGLGQTALRKVQAHARARGISLHDGAKELLETSELTAAARRSLGGLLTQLAGWRRDLEQMSHVELAQAILDDSGYSAMWQKDKSAQAQSRLENLKELIRFMGGFESMAAFLEHISLVMDADNANDGERISIMTLHGAKGLEFDCVFLPGWEEGLFPHQRSLDESGKAGLEEERRLAYVGVTRARKHCTISFAQNRRIHALWQAAIPSRFIDELPAAHVVVVEEAPQDRFGGYGASRFDEPASGFANTYSTPGWQRAQKRWANDDKTKKDKGPVTIDGELVASSTAVSTKYTLGDRVHHRKFGDGTVSDVDGNKLVIDFDDGSHKRVVDSFLSRAG